jgi:cellulose synthase/poly-beta-1,6-N-acetylglucosamine synthase-like glycosyltransferase
VPPLTILSYIYLPLIAAMLLMTIVNSLTIRRVRNSPETVKNSVAILIPMRNERRNVDGVLTSILRSQGMPRCEIVVYDDQSTDGTGELLGGYPIRVIKGDTPPAGWLGKNYALARLSESTDAEILVYLDADVRVTSDAIASAISAMERYRWDFISPYPRQISETLLERLFQPLLQWSWLASVPLRFAERGKHVSMVVANGQFFVLRRDAYRAINGHNGISSDVLDDLALAKKLVKSGFHGSVAEGSEVAECRMYNSAQELIDGYTKSLWRAFGSPLSAATFASILFLTSVLPFIDGLRGFLVGWVGYALSALSRIIAALRTRTLPNMALLHPISILILLYLLVLSFFRRSRGTLHWRGRTVS